MKFSHFVYSNNEYGEQFALVIEQRGGRAAQAAVALAEVLLAMNGQWLALDQAGADAVGAFAGFAPVGAQPQAGALEQRTVARGRQAFEDYPLGIGE